MSQQSDGHADCNAMVCGANTEFQADPCQTQIQADILVSEFTTVRIWGQVRNCRDCPVAGVLLTLVCVERDHCGHNRFHGLAHTISDCDGFYQFDVCANSTNTCYKILANKSAVGTPRVIPPCPPECCRCEPECCRCDSDRDRCEPERCRCDSDRDRCNSDRNRCDPDRRCPR